MKSKLASTEAPNILMADDTPANLQLLSSILQGQGYKPRPVPSGEMALRAAEAATPDLILLDISMPGMDGFETCARLKANPKLADVPVIFLTAHSEVADKMRGFNAGAVDYVTKPFQQEEIEARIRTHLELARLRRELALALADREEVFASIVNQALDGIALVDAETGHFMEFNAAAHEGLGYTRDEFAKLSVMDLQEEHSPESFRQRMEATRNQGGLVFETRHCHRDGSLRDVRVSARLLRVRERDCLATVWTDLTEWKRLEAQLRQAQKLEAIGQLAGGVAHDFNNILAAIMMHLGMLRLRPGLDAETRDALLEVERTAQRGADLTRQMLLFGRRSALTVQPLDLNGVIEDLLKMLRRLIGENVSLRFEGGAGLPAVEANAGMLEQVLTNLVVNARDAMPRGGTITLRTQAVELGVEDVAQHVGRREGRFVRVDVEDVGVGMGSEVLKHLFEPFYTTKEVGKGTGLGLATVHGIVAQHGGWVEVESAVGRGTTFRVYLPASAQALAPKAQAVQATALPGGTETILLVEDNAEVRRVLGQMLRKLGYRVEEAANGPEALRAWPAVGAEVDVLFTDMVMPGSMDGRELAAQLRALKPGLKVIISSGYSTELAKVRTEPEPGVFYLPKPHQMPALAAALRRCLDGEAALPPSQAAPKNAPLTREAVAVLPAALREQFGAAVIRGRYHHLLELTGQVAAVDAELARRMRALIENFDYATLSDLLRDRQS